MLIIKNIDKYYLSLIYHFVIYRLVQCYGYFLLFENIR